MLDSEKKSEDLFVLYFTEMASAKKRRVYRSFKTREFEVEEVIGYKLINNELNFFLKWKGFDQTHNSWEPLECLEKCTVFQEYVHNKFEAHETDIYVNICNIKQRLKKRIRATVQQRKAITMVRQTNFRLPNLCLSLRSS